MRFRLTPTLPTTPTKINCAPVTVSVPTRPLRVLDLDIENRPLSYLGSDFTTAEVTAVAWAWADQPEEVTVYMLGNTSLGLILHEFVKVYNQADLVTGHFIRGHDLPMLNGALMERQEPSLSEKMSHDTKLDLMRSKGLSLSQENLGAMLRLEHGKHPMNQIQWRAANRLSAEGLLMVRDRVVSDVRQHIELRRRLMQLGYLGPPKLWKPGHAPAETYIP